MEMIDILNEDGTPTGKKASKKEIHEKGLWHRAAHIWFVNNKGEILLQKRADHIVSHPGEYDISAAGHLSAGDANIKGAIREVEEELGIKLEERDLIKIGEVHQEGTQYEGTYINKEYNNVYVVHKDIPVEDFTIQEDEVDHVEYILIEDLKSWVRKKKSDLVMHEDEFKILFKYLDEN